MSDAALAELAGRQHGVVARRQLRELGLSAKAVRHRVDLQRLTLVHHNVYAVGHEALPADGWRMAAVLACGPDALLSHRAAADLRRLRRVGVLAEVTVPARRTPRLAFPVHRTRTLDPDDLDVVRGIPVTSVARTVVDLAEVLDERALRRAVHEAEVLRVLDVRAVETTLERLPGRRCAAKLRAVLGEPAISPDNSAFVEAFVHLCSRHGLPRPQVSVLVGASGRSYEADLLFREARLIVELDGEAVHGTRRSFHDDRRRDAALAAEGFQTLRYTWRRVTREDVQVAREVLRVLRLRGWPPNRAL